MANPLHMYTSYSGKTRTDSNIAWHRPQSNPSRIEDELMEKSARALESTTKPIERLRLLCLSRGACGILVLGRRVLAILRESESSTTTTKFIEKSRLVSLMACLVYGLGKIFRKMDHDGSMELNKEEFLSGIKHTGLDINHEEAEELFAHFDTHKKGIVRIDDFIKEIRPPMSAGRRAIVEQAFRKLDKTGEGVIAIEDLRGIYSVDGNPRYKSGEEMEDLIMNKFLAHFETAGEGEGGKVTLEEFMSYYSGISVSMEDDCYFDLVIRQFYKL